MRSIAGIIIVLAFTWTPAAGQYYHTYDQITADLETAEDDYPTLCKRYDLGLSVQGKSIWALRISDNMPTEEDEPEFKYISTMHGDEPVGTVMCMYLIDYLLTNYGVDPDITNLVDEIDIWIIPLMNPDGYELSPRRRENYNWVDLNRDFPDYGEPNTPTGRAPETAVIMNWSFGESFTCSANFHTGALVVNYPFDNDDSGSIYTPDNGLFIWISEQYSQHNQPMWDNPAFQPHGITNGAEWYMIWGGMQDWNYHFMGNNEVTIELCGYPKERPVSELPQFWDWNRDSMLAYMATCLIGVRGIVTDGQTGLPLAATVTVADRNHEVYTDPDVGDYHRMLLPGTYEVMVEAPGYDAMIHPGVVVSIGDATRWDVVLGTPTNLVSPNGGEEVTAGVPTIVSWTGNPAAPFHVQYTANADETSVVSDGFESGTLDPAYTTGGDRGWLVTTGSPHTGSYSAHNGDIGDSERSWLKRTASSGPMSFWYRVSSEENYDFFRFYVDGDQRVEASGSVGWTYYSETLDSGTHELEWEYAKDVNTSNGSDTAWIDDLEITIDNTTWTDVIAMTPPGATSTSWTPPAEGTDYKVRTRAEFADGSHGAWDESDETFTVLPANYDPIPTISQWGMVVMTLLVLTVGTVVFIRRPSALIGRPAMLGKGSVLVVAMFFIWACPLCLGGDELDIYSAARIGDLQRLEVLLERTPDSVNAKDASGQTPLHQAVRGLHAKAVERLLAAGADVNAKNRHGAGPLHLTALSGGNKREEKAKRQTVTALLLDNGVDVKAVDEHGKTALHLAAIKNRTEMLKQLAGADADIAAKDSLGRTPLYDAALSNHKAVIKWLLSKGADVNTADKQGDTPLHWAARRFRKEATEMLIVAGARVNAKNARGETPLHVAALQGPDVEEVDHLLTAVARVLLQNKADVNAKDTEGATPLHHALAQRHEELADLLRQHGGRE